MRHITYRASAQLVSDLVSGEVPVKEALDMWRANGYDGYVCVEWEKKWHPQIPEPEVALPQHADKLREYLAAMG